MSPSDSDKENAATSRDMTLNPIAIAESSSRIIQQSRQALAPKANFDPLSSSSSASRPQLFDAKGRPTHFPSRASYRYHNGTLSVKRQRTHAPSTQTQSSAPSTSELLALAENDDSDNDADGERDWEVCDHDFSAASPPLQFSVGRRVELTGVRKSIPLLASLSMVRNVSPSAPGPSAPEQPKSLEPERPPGPPLPAPEPAVFASEPQKSIGGLLPPFPLLPSTQESELTELGEFEGLLYDFPLVPQRQAAAAAEARFSVQVKREAIQRAIAPPKTPHGQKGRSGNGVIWTVGEEIDLVRFIFKDSVQFEWDRKSVSKQLPAGRSADEVQARWKTLLNYLNGHGELPNAETTTPWSLDEDDEILSAIIDCIPTYGRALAFGKEQGGRIRTANAFGSKWLKLKANGLASWIRKVGGVPSEEPHVTLLQPSALPKPESESTPSEVKVMKSDHGKAKRKRDAMQDEASDVKASKKMLRSDDVVKWTLDEDKRLVQAVAKYAQVDWNLVRAELSGRSPTSSKPAQALERRWNVLKDDLLALSGGKLRPSGLPRLTLNMSSFSATISKITESERWPKTPSEWALPVVAAAATAVALSIIVNPPSPEVKGYTRDPPMVPSWIPWIGSFWEIESDPDAFFRQAEKEYPGGIIAVRAAGKKFFFVTSSDLINQIYKKPTVYALSPVQMGWAKSVFSLSDQALYGSPMFSARLAPHMDRSMAPKNMMGLIKSFENHVRQEVQFRAVPSQPVSLQDFVIKLSYVATGAAYFGPTFNAMGTWDAFKGFDESVYKVALGYPASLLRTFVRCREEMIGKFVEYLDKPHDACELIRGQEEIIRDVPFDKRDMGCMMLCAWWPLMANVPWGTLWVLLHQLQRPEGVQPLLDELTAAGTAWSSAHPEFTGSYTLHLTEFLQSNPSLPLLSSVIAESLRFATDSYSMRAVVDGDAMLGPYMMRDGDMIVCSTRSVHMDEKEFERASEWIPTRFVAEDGSAKGTEGSFKWMPFGGGISMCSGRFFANYHVKIFLATLLTNFKFTVDTEKSQLPITVGPINRGFGLRRPKGDLFVKVDRA